jgi:adenylate cyclase
MKASHEEIERRFLVRGVEWRTAGTPRHIVQGYLSTDRSRVVRVRMSGESAWLTVKGPAQRSDSRREIECDIPPETARAILTEPGLCVGTVIEKVRYTLRIGELTWEVDEFGGRNSGLRIAEVEYDGTLELAEWHARVDVEQPSWAGAEITGLHRYSNSALTEAPFDEWPAPDRAAVQQGLLPGAGFNSRARS